MNEPYGGPSTAYLFPDETSLRIAEAKRARKAAKRERDAHRSEAGQAAARAKLSAKQHVVRGHCNRCDRCGWPYASNRTLGCVYKSCSVRPLPAPRDTCAGCGGTYKIGGAS